MDGTLCVFPLSPLIMCAVSLDWMSCRSGREGEDEGEKERTGPAAAVSSSRQISCPDRLTPHATSSASPPSAPSVRSCPSPSLPRSLLRLPASSASLSPSVGSLLNLVPSLTCFARTPTACREPGRARSSACPPAAADNAGLSLRVDCPRGRRLKSTRPKSGRLD